MTRRGIQKAAGAAVVVMLALGITGCGATDQDNAALSSQQQTMLEARMPDLARSMGATYLDLLHEESCLVEAPSKQLPRKTRWVSQAAVLVPDDSVADEVGASLRTQAERQGWQTLPEDQWRSGAGRVVYQADDPDSQARLTAYHDTYNGRSGVVLLATTECLDMPEDNLLTYSRLDPDFGYASTRLEVEDVPDAPPAGNKPLPASTQTPAPTGPAGASPVGKVTQ